MKPWVALLGRLTNSRVTTLRYSLEDGQSRSDLVDGRTIATRLLRSKRRGNLLRQWGEKRRPGHCGKRRLTNFARPLQGTKSRADLYGRSAITAFRDALRVQIGGKGPRSDEAISLMVAK